MCNIADSKPHFTNIWRGLRKSSDRNIAIFGTRTLTGSYRFAVYPRMQRCRLQSQRPAASHQQSCHGDEVAGSFSGDDVVIFVVCYTFFTRENDKKPAKQCQNERWWRIHEKSWLYLFQKRARERGFDTFFICTWQNVRARCGFIYLSVPSVFVLRRCC